MTSYLTIARDAQIEIEVKSSRFQCTMQRVPSEVSARALVSGLRKQHWDARHGCSAFVLGPDSALQRSSDDGEPAGTAGAPMLDVLRGAAVSDVAGRRALGRRGLTDSSLDREYACNESIVTV